MSIAPPASKMYYELFDKSSTGRKRPWNEKKLYSMYIAGSFERNGSLNKAFRMSHCGDYLLFREYPDGRKKLRAANFCKVRLCPMCAWRWSLKIYGQVYRVISELQKDGKYAYLFLTLTVKNCHGEDLPSYISDLMHGYKEFFRISRVKKAVKGVFRALEVTHNLNEKSKSFDTFHPHIHCILAVPKSYFSRPAEYIRQVEWADLWKKAMRLDYNPVVDVRRIYDKSADDGAASGLCDMKSMAGAVAECAKYTVKDGDLVCGERDMVDKTIDVLERSLAGRRLVSFRGEFAKIHKQLDLDDSIDGDLVNVGDSGDVEGTDYQTVLYVWHRGFWGYVKDSLCGKPEPGKDAAPSIPGRDTRLSQTRGKGGFQSSGGIVSPFTKSPSLPSQ